MAYSVTIPPVCVVPSSGAQLWIYNSADVHTDVDADDYFTDGDALGMKVGDHVIVGKNTATIGSTVHFVWQVTAGGAASVKAAILA